MQTFFNLWLMEQNRGPLLLGPIPDDEVEHVPHVFSPTQPCQWNVQSVQSDTDDDMDTGYRYPMAPSFDHPSIQRILKSAVKAGPFENLS